MADILDDCWIFAGITVTVPKDELDEKTAVLKPYADKIGGQIYRSISEAGGKEPEATLGIVVSSPGTVGISPRDFMERKNRMEEAGLELFANLGLTEYLTRREFFNLYPPKSRLEEYCLEHSTGVSRYAYTVRDRKTLEDRHPRKAAQMFQTTIDEELKTIFREMEEHIQRKKPRERRIYRWRINRMRRHLTGLRIRLD